MTGRRPGSAQRQGACAQASRPCCLRAITIRIQANETTLNLIGFPPYLVQTNKFEKLELHICWWLENKGYHVGAWIHDRSASDDLWRVCCSPKAEGWIYASFECPRLNRFRMLLMVQDAFEGWCSNTSVQLLYRIPSETPAKQSGPECSAWGSESHKPKLEPSVRLLIPQASGNCNVGASKIRGP